MKAETSGLLEFGDFRLNLEERCLFQRDGKEVPLTPRVFETLRYLIEHQGRVLEKEHIMEAVWPDCIVEENNLAQNISTLRRIFGETRGSQQYIVTVPGRGYRFVPEVRPSESQGVRDSDAFHAAAQPADSNAKRPSLRVLSGATLVLLLIGVLALSYWRSSRPGPRQSAAVPAKSIAVLPFVNLSDDKRNLYFVAGVQDEILSNLAKIGDLKVISRTSANLYLTGNPRNLREIGEQLGVAHLVEGSVQLTGQRLRINAQLVDARTDIHLWAQTYDRDVSDVFAIQSEIAQAIALQLQATLTAHERRALATRPTVNFEAYEAYLQGRYFWNKRTVEGLRQAVEHFGRAIQVDPTFAQAYVGLADAHLFLGGGNADQPEGQIEKTRSLLKKALELDETLGEAHATLGLLAMNIDWDWAVAENEFKRAIQLNSNYATAHQWFGEFLAYMGRFEEAFAENARAHELDPLSLIINTDLAKTYLLARRYDEAIALFHAALKIDPEFAEANGLLGLTYAKLGRDAEAMERFQKIRNLENNPAYLSWLAIIHGLAGRVDAAHKTIERMNELARQHYVSPFLMAIAWTGLGEKDEVFKWYERVFAEHASGGAVTLKVNPLFDDLRSDSRFTELLRRANFTP